MATAVEERVERQIADATSRIRFHDLARGGLILGGMVLAYAAAMILLDKALVLPQAVRQGAFCAFLAGCGVAAYVALVRPFARRVNPLYAAVQVEKTIENAQNSVASYVDLKDRDVPPAIRTAIAGRAAKAAAKADLNRAVDHRGLTVLGGVAAVLVVTLVVLFFAFRPPQFLSLAKRAFAPFTAGEIATRTRLTNLRPADGDVTVTAGQPVAVGARVEGRVPAADTPDRPRLLLRHNPADPNYDEIPLEPGSDPREFDVRVPDYLVQNGFWYKLAAGDAETPEFKVTVRSKPLVIPDTFRVDYDYPAYLRMRPETDRDPRIVAPRGTVVTVTAKTNRQVREGRLELTFENRAVLPLTVLSDPVPGQPDALRFKFAVTQTGGYKITFTDTNGESSPDPFPGTVQAISDQPPTVTITKPAEEEIRLPANGQLAVDADIGDDNGIDAAALRLRLRPDPADREKKVELAGKPFQGGKSFAREADGTYPTAVEYKDSVELAKLTDAAGQKVELKAGQVLEYWVEAADNCREKEPNVGRSRVQRVVLEAPVKEPEPQQKQDQDRQQRRAEEQKNNQQQQQRHDQEKREPKKGPHEPRPEDQPDPPADGKNDTPPQPQDGNPAPKDGKTEGAPKDAKTDPANPKGDTPPPNKDAPMPTGGAKDAPPPKPKDGEPEAKPQDNPMPGGAGNDPNAPKQPPEPGAKNQTGGEGGKGGPNDQQLQKQADQVQKELDREKTQGGEPKPNNTPDPDAAPPQPESKPTGGEQGGSAAESKAGPPPAAPNDPKGGGPQPESKPEGKLEPPPKPAENKPDGGQPMNQPNGGGSEKEDKFGGAAGQDRPAPQPGKTEPKGGPPEPKGGPPEPKAGDPKGQPGDDDNRPGDAKPAGSPQTKPGANEPKTGDPKENPEPGSGGPQPKDRPQDPTGGAAKSKPMPEPGRGTSREPDARPQPGPKEPQPNPDAGSAKPEQSPDAGADRTESKPAPQPDGGQKGSDPKPAPQEGNPGTAKPDTDRKGDAKTPGGRPEPKPGDPAAKEPQPGTDGEKSGDPTPPRGTERPTPTADGARGGPKDDGPKQPGAAPQPKEKIDPKEIEDAARDLNSPDKDKQQAARDKLDKTIGKDAREQAEQLAKDLQSPDQATRDAAEKKVKDALEKAREQAEKDRQVGNTPQPTPGDPAGDPKSDPKGPKPGDPKAGPDAADPKGPKSGDAGTDPQKADGPKTEPKQDPNAKGTGPKKDGGGKKLSPEQMQELAKKAGDLNSPDKDKREAAEKEFDKAVGKENREAMQKLAKDLDSSDEKTREAAREKVKEIAKKAQEEADRQAKKDGPPGKDGKPDPKGEPLTKEQREELAKKLQDLASPDQDTRKKAEQEFDDKLGKENREALQKAVQDAAKGKNPGDPPGQDDAKKKLDELAQNPPKGGNKGEFDPKAGGGGFNNPPAKPMDDDPRNRLKSAELQLEQFKKNEHNKDLQDRLKMTPDEYQRFVKGYEEMVNRMRADADPGDRPAPKPPAAAPGYTTGSGGRVEAKSTNTAGGGAAGGGAVFAPPGFQDAQKKFAEEANRRPAKK